MNNKKSVGLPGGPNEYITDISEFISIEGYSTGSKDINNPVNIIESGSITMKDVDFPVLGTDNLGNSQMMFPENNYQFPGDSVFEIPMAQAGFESMSMEEQALHDMDSVNSMSMVDWFKGLGTQTTDGVINVFENLKNKVTSTLTDTHQVNKVGDTMIDDDGVKMRWIGDAWVPYTGQLAAAEREMELAFSRRGYDDEHGDYTYYSYENASRGSSSQFRIYDIDPTLMVAVSPTIEDVQPGEEWFEGKIRKTPTKRKKEKLLKIGPVDMQQIPVNMDEPVLEKSLPYEPRPLKDRVKDISFNTYNSSAADDADVMDKHGRYFTLTLEDGSTMRLAPETYRNYFGTQSVVTGKDLRVFDHLKRKKQKGGDLLQAEKGWGDKALDYAQTAGSVAGLFPFVGNAVDIVNAGVSGLRAGYAGYTGDTEGAKNHSENAALNLASAIPFAGQAAGTAAIAKDIAQYTGAMDGSAITNIQDSIPASINVAKNTIPNTEPIKIAQSGVELPDHLESVDLSKINEENSTKINSNAYRERLKAEYLNAHNIELSEVDLDNMVGDLNNQLTLGADEGTKGFYTQNVPDGNAAGFMFSGPGQIDIDGNQVTPRTAGYDWNNATTGNIYIARNISQENPYNEIDNENGYGMPGTSMEESVIQHEVNHRLNSLAGSPLSSATVGPLYDESYKYHNSFFDNAPDDNPFNAKFEDESFREYATQPFEIKSQKAQLEQSLLNAGIWDPSKGPFTQSHVDEMVRKNITFNKGFGYLQRGLGINELVEGTIDTPGNLTNPINSYSEYSEDPFNDFLGNRGLEDFSSGYSKEGDMRNSSPRAYNRIKKTLSRTEQGSKKWNEWASKQRPAQEQYFNAKGDSKGIKQAIDGDYPDKNTEALLLARGIKVGPNGYYEQKDDAAINTILTEYQNITDQYKNAYDEVRDSRPKEEGLFGAFGPLKNIKGRKAEKKAVKEYNRHYKTDYKEWRDIVFEHNDGGVSQADKNVTKSATESSGYNYIINNFDREISSLRDLQRTGGHENRRAFAKSDFKVKGDFRMSRKGGKDDFNLDLANDYISSLDNDPNIDKFNSEYRPANVFDNDAGYQYFGREEGRVLREQGRSNFNAALDNDIWRNDLYTQAVLNLPKGYRDSFIEYYSQEPDQKFTTKAEIKKQAKLVRKIRGSMPDIRNFIEARRKDNEEYIEDGNNQYEIDKNQQLINDELNNQNLNNKIAPNLIKFMNEVAMEDGSMPTELAQYGIELPIAQADATNVYQQNPNIPIAEEETVMPGLDVIYDPTNASRNPNLQWMMGAQPGVTPGTSYADDVATGYNELIAAATPVPILEGLQLTSKGARIPGLIDDGIINPIFKGYKWMKSALSSGSKNSSSGTKAAQELDLEAMADRLDEMNAAFVKSTDPALSKAEKNAAAEIWAAENLDEIAAMNNLIEKNPKLKVSYDVRKKLNDLKETGAFIGDGGSQIKKTNLEVYINPKTGEIEQFHSLAEGKVTAKDLEENLPWEIDWAGNINKNESAMSLKKIQSQKGPYIKDQFGAIDIGKTANEKTIDFGPWKNQKGGEPSIQDNTFIAAAPEVIIDQVSENDKKENHELGLSNILSYMVDTRGGTENLWTDLADNIAYHESGYEQRMDPKAIQRSNEYVDGKKTGNIIPGPGRGMFQFESKELNGSGSFTTAQKRYKNVAEATGLKLNKNILNAKEATELSKQDQYTLFFANLIESKAVLKNYADGNLLAEDVWLKGHKNVSVDGNKESFRSSVKNAKADGIKNGYSEFTLEELLSYKNGGEYNIFQDYVTGNYDNTNYEKEGKDTYDKLNRIHYKAAKEIGMSPANYIMTNLMGHS